MSTVQIHETTPRRPLRLWPGVAAAALIFVMRLVLPAVTPEAMVYGLLGSVAGGAVILLWWVFFSHAPWPERLAAPALMLVTVIIMRSLVHPSIATGMMGMMYFLYAVPLTLSIAFVAWAVVSGRLSNALRWATMVAAIVLGCGVWTLVRTEGITGAGGAQLAWRWTPTPEERLLAEGGAPVQTAPQPSNAPSVAAEQTSPSSPPAPSTPGAPADAAGAPGAPGAVAPAPADAATPAPEASAAGWPGFRGSNRDSVVTGLRIATDWTSSRPVEVWRRPVGPGWSSFAVRGNRFYTQEQRGNDEVVAAYDLATGKPVWTHRDPVRFWESNGGAGPRATPTVSGQHVYTVGATGILNALDARTGSRLWTRNAAADTDAKVPYWGFSGSPLVIDDMVIVYVGGLVAYDRSTGAPRWVGKSRRGSYSSPHPATIGGVRQILQLTSHGAFGASPSDGTELWEHAWAGTTIVQPAVAGASDILISTADGMGGTGMRRLAVVGTSVASASSAAGGWTTEERWTSNGLKPYFNDFVVHKGYGFGFDGRILSCIDLNDGARKWKGGRYGNGQLLLLADSDVMLVLSEDGELALVRATPDQFVELARVPAINGKTWNHPAIAGDILLVRNGEEMAAFRLPTAAR